MYQSATQAYRSVSITSASSERILDDVFARIDQWCTVAISAIERGDIAGRGKAIGSAIELLTALATALDHEQAPDLCQSLLRLYEFAIGRLVYANLHADARSVNEARTVLTEVRGGFAEAANLA